MTIASECAIEALLKNSFRSLSFTDKLSIIQKDRPKELWKTEVANASIKGARRP